METLVEESGLALEDGAQHNYAFRHPMQVPPAMLPLSFLLSLSSSSASSFSSLPVSLSVSPIPSFSFALRFLLALCQTLFHLLHDSTIQLNP